MCYQGRPHHEFPRRAGDIVALKISAGPLSAALRLPEPIEIPPIGLSGAVRPDEVAKKIKSKKPRKKPDDKVR